MAIPSLNKHRCPARLCSKVVPDRLLACPEHWFKLPATARQQIERTANLPSIHPDRRAALEAAMACWKETAQ
jgi:hypothetical protein